MIKVEAGGGGGVALVDKDKQMLEKSQLCPKWEHERDHAERQRFKPD